jgi:hypothetical protein
LWWPTSAGERPRLGDHRRHGQAAEPALARPHAAAGEGLGLVRPLATQRDRRAQLGHGNFLAAADHDLRVAGREYFGARPVERVEKTA